MDIHRKSLGSSSDKGFTLIEVLIFVAISSIILVVLISTTVSVFRQTQITTHTAYATRYADELSEWLRIQKELSWQTFYEFSKTGTSSASTYEFCANGPIKLDSILTEVMSPYTASSCLTNGILYTSTDGDLNTIPRVYKRTVVFTPGATSSDGILATIKVAWLEIGNAQNTVQIQTYFAPR